MNVYLVRVARSGDAKDYHVVAEDAPTAIVDAVRYYKKHNWGYDARATLLEEVHKDVVLYKSRPAKKKR